MRRLVKELRTQGDKQKNKGKPKWTGKDENGDALWSTILIDLGFYYVVITGIMIMVHIFVPRIYQDAAATLARGCPECSTEELVRLRDMVRETKSVFGFTPVQGLLYAVLWSALTLLPLGAYYAILHSMVHMFLTTEGTFRGMLHYCARFNLILLGILLALAGMTLVFFLKDAFNPEFYDLLRYGDYPIWGTTINLLQLVLLVGGLWSLRRVVVFYRVGCFQVGCVILISSAITSAAIGGILSQLFASALQVFAR